MFLKKFSLMIVSAISMTNSAFANDGPWRVWGNDVYQTNNNAQPVTTQPVTTQPYMSNPHPLDVHLRPYIGVDLNKSRLSVQDVEEDIDLGAVGLKLGTDITDILGIEGRIGVGIMDNNSTYTEQNVTFKDDFRMNNYIAGFVKLQTPSLNGFRIKGLAGVASVDFQNDYTITDSVETIQGRHTENDSGFAYGAGLSYALTESLSTEVEYLKLQEDMDTVNLGLTYHF